MYKENPYLRYLRSEILPTPFCPGCGGGIVLNVFTRAIERLALDVKKLICVTGIGCSSWIPSPFFRADTLHTTHGRAIAFATGIKIMQPDKKVVVIAGDGDIAGIGANHLLHAARRNIDLNVLLINNSIYGMTGGQVAPTTPYGVKTTTTPYGNPEHPFDVAETVSAAGASFVARWTTYHAVQLEKAIAEAIMKKGFSFVEVISQCPVSYGKSIGMRRPSDFLKMFKEKSVSVKKAKDMSAAELEDRIIVGKIHETERAEFAEALRSIIEKASLSVG